MVKRGGQKGVVKKGVVKRVVKRGWSNGEWSKGGGLKGWVVNGGESRNPFCVWERATFERPCKIK